MLVSGSMGEVDPGDVHSTCDESLEHFRIACRRADRADDLRFSHRISQEIRKGSTKDTTGFQQDTYLEGTSRHLLI